MRKLREAAQFALDTLRGDVLDAVTGDYASDHNIYEAIERLEEALESEENV
jgi:TusA-related sulfurtransferase